MSNLGQKEVIIWQHAFDEAEMRESGMAFSGNGNGAKYVWISLATSLARDIE